MFRWMMSGQMYIFNSLLLLETSIRGKYQRASASHWRTYCSVFAQVYHIIRDLKSLSLPPTKVTSISTVCLKESDLKLSTFHLVNQLNWFKPVLGAWFGVTFCLDYDSIATKILFNFRFQINPNQRNNKPNRTERWREEVKLNLVNFV